MTVDFHLDGTPFTAINGGPEFTFTEAMSLLVDCADQDEVDHYWDALSAGGETRKCGWLKDRYGLSWQVCPDELGGLLADPDPARASRVPGDADDGEDRHRRRAGRGRRRRAGSHATAELQPSTSSAVSPSPLGDSTAASTSPSPVLTLGRYRSPRSQ